MEDLAGTEFGAFLRATCLLLIKSIRRLEEVAKFLRRFVKGDILAVLRKIRFATYAKEMVAYVPRFVGKLIEIIRAVRAEPAKLPFVQLLDDVPQRLTALENAFDSLQQRAVAQIPAALAELDARVTKLLSEMIPPTPRPAMAGVPAGHAAPVMHNSAQAPSMPSNPLGRPPETVDPPRLPDPVKEQTNLHPEHSAISTGGYARTQPQLEDLARDPAHGG